MNNSDGTRGLYIHVPFCRGKCPYCDFYSTPALSLVKAWLSAIRKEALMYTDRFPAFDSLYLGGGTPTIISDDGFKELIDFIRDHFIFADDTEITVEANPEDVTSEKLAALRSCGVNRLSIGVQSFNDEELTTLKRRHSARAAEAALNLARSAGFENIGIDLICLVPGQTEESWMSSLRRALSFEPAHLSCYQMTFEERTPFGRMKAEGKIVAADEETERTFFLLTSRFLRGAAASSITKSPTSPAMRLRAHATTASTGATSPISGSALQPTRSTAPPVGGTFVQ